MTRSNPREYQAEPQEQNVFNRTCQACDSLLSFFEKEIGKFDQVVLHEVQETISDSIESLCSFLEDHEYESPEKIERAHLEVNDVIASIQHLINLLNSTEFADMSEQRMTSIREHLRRDDPLYQCLSLTHFKIESCNYSLQCTPKKETQIKTITGLVLDEEIVISELKQHNPTESIAKWVETNFTILAKRLDKSRTLNHISRNFKTILVPDFLKLTKEQLVSMPGIKAGTAREILSIKKLLVATIIRCENPDLKRPSVPYIKIDKLLRITEEELVANNLPWYIAQKIYMNIQVFLKTYPEVLSTSS